MGASGIQWRLPTTVTRQEPPTIYVQPARQNPALRAWAAGVACHKDWKPGKGGKISFAELQAMFSTPRNDHPGRKT